MTAGAPIEFSEALAHRMLVAARARAIKRGFSCSLTVSSIKSLWASDDGRCAVSGIRFSSKRYRHAFVKQPFSQSLDRINSRKGYSPSNTRLVCVAANFAMNDWGLEVLAELAVGVRTLAKRKGSRQTEVITLKRKTIGEAEKAESQMSGAQLIAQRRRIAALKRAFTLGPAGLRRAARKAAETRRSHVAKPVTGRDAFRPVKAVRHFEIV